MDVLFEGRLTHELQLKHVLQRILTLKTKGLTILRLASPQPEFDGKVLFSDGRFIQGAKLDDESEYGYRAVRRLFAMADGNFGYMTTNRQESAYLESNMNLMLERVIQLVPSLPESASIFFDEKSLLDKVFSSASLEPIKPQTQIEQTGPQPVISKPKGQDADWRLLKPMHDLPPDEEFEMSEDDDDYEQEELAEEHLPAVKTEELERLLESTKAPKPPECGTIKEARPTESAPLLLMAVVGFALAAQIAAIAFWRPFKTFVEAKFPATAKYLEVHPAQKPPQRRYGGHRHKY